MRDSPGVASRDDLLGERVAWARWYVDLNRNDPWRSAPIQAHNVGVIGGGVPPTRRRHLTGETGHPFLTVTLSSNLSRAHSLVRITFPSDCSVVVLDAQGQQD